jgi:hypothetical protein
MGLVGCLMLSTALSNHKGQHRLQPAMLAAGLDFSNAEPAWTGCAHIVLQALRCSVLAVVLVLATNSSAMYSPFAVPAAAAAAVGVVLFVRCWCVPGLPWQHTRAH